MKLQALIEELKRQKSLKWDEQCDSSQLRMVVPENQLKFQIRGKDKSLSITKPCHRQIAERLGIPPKYYHRMESEAPDLLVQNVNTWLERTEKAFFIRGLDQCRFLLTRRAAGGCVIKV